MNKYSLFPSAAHRKCYDPRIDTSLQSACQNHELVVFPTAGATLNPPSEAHITDGLSRVPVLERLAKPKWLPRRARTGNGYLRRLVCGANDLASLRIFRCSITSSFIFRCPHISLCTRVIRLRIFRIDQSIPMDVEEDICNAI